MLAVIFGKTIGISLFTWVTTKFKVSLPEGMTMKDVIVAGFVGGIGLTVALFVCESAFTDASLVSAAKMGALFTVVSAVPAFIVAKILGIKKVQN
jgi:NhaA family Na+:H+ antiporter